MSERKYLNQPEPVLTAVLTGKFDNGLGQTLDVPSDWLRSLPLEKLRQVDFFPDGTLAINAYGKGKL